MKVDILENDIFNALSPEILEKYLVNRKWKEITRIQNEVSIWDNELNGELIRAWLPLNEGFGDYASSVKRVVKTISLFEDRSQLEIIEDFDTIASGDVIRVKSHDILNKTDGTLYLNDGFALIQKAKDMLLAAACASIEPKSVFPSRKPIKVENYAKKVRLGQTERGSYVIKLISPVIDQTEQNFQEYLPNEPPQIPFGRLVTKTLVNSLKSLKNILLHLEKKGRFYFEPFQEEVSNGVSANLCDAITGNNNADFRPIEIGVSFSYLFAQNDMINLNPINFPTELMPFIAEASRLFHEKNPEDNFILEGYVTKLQREKHGGKGSIDVISFIENKKRRVKIELDEKDYSLAIEAHKQGLEIYCTGQMIKDGNTFRLNNPSNFKMLDDS